MERKQLIERLNDLLQLDVDAVEAYDQIIKHMEYDDIRRRLIDFQDDHRSHVRNLTEAVQQLDGKPVKDTPDFKGYLIEVFTMLMSVSGSIGAIEALKANEVLTNRKYTEATTLEWPEGIKKLIFTNYSQEQRHMNYVEELLTTPRHELR